MWFYRAVRPLVTGIPRLIWRVRIVGLEHVPASGGFVLAPLRDVAPGLVDANRTWEGVREAGVSLALPPLT